jgi:transcriptional regulator with XRE-family HTH domain
MDLEKAGQTIRELRKGRKKSQEKVSFDGDIDRSFYSEIERGESTPSMPTIFKIAKGLKLKPSEVMKAIEENQPEENKFWLKDKEEE